MCSDLDTMVPETVIADGLTYPYRITLDPVGAKMYWTTVGAGMVRRANLDGTGLETIVDLGASSNTGVAVDGVSGRLYWAQADSVWSSSLDGSDAAVLFEVGAPGYIQDIALEPDSGTIYVSNWNGLGSGRLQRANLDGSGLEDVLSSVDQGPAGLAVDAAGGKVYWGSWNIDPFATGGVRRANLDGSGVETLADGIDADSLALDLSAGKAYWTVIDYATSTGSIQRSNLNGSNLETLPFGDMLPAGIAFIPEPGTLTLLLLLLGVAAAPHRRS
jgi:DNA-binding beta-propeller fold protein YncE